MTIISFLLILIFNHFLWTWNYFDKTQYAHDNVSVYSCIYFTTRFFSSTSCTHIFTMFNKTEGKTILIPPYYIYLLFDRINYGRGCVLYSSYTNKTKNWIFGHTSTSSVNLFYFYSRYVRLDTIRSIQHTIWCAHTIYPNKFKKIYYVSEIGPWSVVYNVYMRKIGQSKIIDANGRFRHLIFVKKKTCVSSLCIILRRSLRKTKFVWFSPS